MNYAIKICIVTACMMYCEIGFAQEMEKRLGIVLNCKMTQTIDNRKSIEKRREQLLREYPKDGTLGRSDRTEIVWKGEELVLGIMWVNDSKICVDAPDERVSLRGDKEWADDTTVVFTELGTDSFEEFILTRETIKKLDDGMGRKTIRGEKGRALAACGAHEETIVVSEKIGNWMKEGGIYRIDVKNGDRWEESFEQKIRINRIEPIYWIVQKPKTEEDYANVHLRSGYRHYYNREGDSGRSEFETALGLNPGLAAARLALCAIYERDREYKKCHMLLEEGMRHGVEDAGVRKRMSARIGRMKVCMDMGRCPELTVGE